MEKVSKFVGIAFYIVAFLFMIVSNFIVTGNEAESFSRDIFGLQIPHPPLWTSYIPYLGGILAYVFEMFSLHGLLSLAIFISLILLGNFFSNVANDKKE